MCVCVLSHNSFRNIQFVCAPKYTKRIYFTDHGEKKEHTEHTILNYSSKKCTRLFKHNENTMRPSITSGHLTQTNLNSAKLLAVHNTQRLSRCVSLSLFNCVVLGCCCCCCSATCSMDTWTWAGLYVVVTIYVHNNYRTAHRKIWSGSEHREHTPSKWV